MFTAHSVAVFIHLLAAFLMMGGNLASRAGLMHLRSATTAHEALGAYRAYALAPRLTSPAVVVTVVSGIGIAWYVGVLQVLWAAGSVVLWVGLNIWRGVVVLPPAKVLKAAAAQAAADPAAHGPALLAAARQPRLHFGHLGMELTNCAIIALMVFKPA